MDYLQLQTELQKIDKRLTVEPNPNREGLANVKLNGKDVIPCPVNDIREEPDPNYFYTFPNGMHGRHKSVSEILTEVNRIIELIKTDDGRDSFFGTGEYA